MGKRCQNPAKDALGHDEMMMMIYLMKFSILRRTDLIRFFFFKLLLFVVLAYRRLDNVVVILT